MANETSKMKIVVIPGQPFPMMADAGLEQMVSGARRAAKALR